jgi:hypothetical protein
MRFRHINQEDINFTHTLRAYRKVSVTKDAYKFLSQATSFYHNVFVHFRPPPHHMDPAVLGLPSSAPSLEFVEHKSTTPSPVTGFWEVSTLLSVQGEVERLAPVYI